MYKCRLTYDEWKCILSKERVGRTVNSNSFNGYIGLLIINKVLEPQVWKFNHEDIIVCDDGFKWLTILPHNEFFCITTVMNEENEIAVWYIDIINSQGYDENGIPYFEDLYLDVVVYPDGEIIVDDMDELEKALQENDITEEQFDLAIKTSMKLKEGLLSDINEFIKYTKECYVLLN